MEHVADDLRNSLLLRYGNFPLAYSVAFQSGLDHFGNEHGFLSYKKIGRTALVLADPLAEPGHRESLIDSFLSAHSDAGFWQISRQTAEILSRRGFFINEFGCESFVKLNEFSFLGPKFRNFRTAEKRFAGLDYRVEEVPLGKLDPGVVEAVSRNWRQTKKQRRRELQFLVRPVVLADEPGVRKFFLIAPNGKLEAFAFFDPLYENGRVAGYLSATRRWLPTTDPLAGYFLMKRAMETFQAEGIGELHLGLSPFHHIEDKEFRKNWLMRRSFRFIYTNQIINRLLYPVQNLAKHKESYGGFERQTYYAFNKVPSLPRLFKFILACRIIA